ncbi:hypothetical protein D3C76_1101800 [compost metagenome]
MSSEEAIHDVLITSFQQSMDSGEMRPNHPLFLAHSFSALMALGNREETEVNNQSYANLAHAIVDLFWNGTASKL